MEFCSTKKFLKTFQKTYLAKTVIKVPTGTSKDKPTTRLSRHFCPCSENCMIEKIQIGGLNLTKYEYRKFAKTYQKTCLTKEVVKIPTTNCKENSTMKRMMRVYCVFYASERKSGKITFCDKNPNLTCSSRLKYGCES